MPQSKKQVQREFDSYSDNVGVAVTDPSAKSGQHSLSHIMAPGSNYWTPDDGGAETNNTILLLRRIVKILEAVATVDSANRQRVAIDSVTGVISTMGVAVAAGPNTPTLAAPVMPGTAVYWQPIWEGPVDQRWRIIDAARQSYNSGIRNHLSFT
jgi:hypothetical protein